ncbi:MAG: hypothetical protein GX882_09395 [Methanomicrobiales archaeon]|nr:hypothetical protein [Methanomicrobiales archaeon]
MDIPQDNVTWSDLYAVQPLASTILSMTLTGEQIRNVLEQKRQTTLPPHNLAVPGLSYTFDDGRPAGEEITGSGYAGMEPHRCRRRTPG